MSAVLLIVLCLLAVAVPAVGVGLTIRLFRSRVTKPDLVETMVAIAAGLGAAVAAGVIGFVVAGIACTALLTGEAGEAGLIFAPCVALVFAMMTFVITLRVVLRHGDRPISSGQNLG